MHIIVCNLFFLENNGMELGRQENRLGVVYKIMILSNHLQTISYNPSRSQWRILDENEGLAQLLSTRVGTGKQQARH